MFHDAYREIGKIKAINHARTMKDLLAFLIFNHDVRCIEISLEQRTEKRLKRFEREDVNLRCTKKKESTSASPLMLYNFLLCFSSSSLLVCTLNSSEAQKLLFYSLKFHIINYERMQIFIFFLFPYKNAGTEITITNFMWRRVFCQQFDK